jgi:hypothetical protein
VRVYISTWAQFFHFLIKDEEKDQYYLGYLFLLWEQLFIDFLHSLHRILSRPECNLLGRSFRSISTLLQTRTYEIWKPSTYYSQSYVRALCVLCSKLPNPRFNHTVTLSTRLHAFFEKKDWEDFTKDSHQLLWQWFQFNSFTTARTRVDGSGSSTLTDALNANRNYFPIIIISVKSLLLLFYERTLEQWKKR